MPEHKMTEMTLDKFALEAAWRARKNNWGIASVCAAIRREYYKGMDHGDGAKPAPGERIDTQAYEDVKGLIDAEMGEVACGNYTGTERLAALILGRLGHELPAQEVDA